MKPYDDLRAFLQSALDAEKRIREETEAERGFIESLLDLGFVMEETDPLFLSSPASQISNFDVSVLKTLPDPLKYISKIPGPQGLKGDKGDKGESIKGEPGYTPIKGKDYFDGKPGKNGKDGRDGKDAEVNTKELRALAEAPVKQHEKDFDHSLLHDSHLLGTKLLDEGNLQDDTFIKYDKQKDKFVLAEIPKAKQSITRSGGGSSLSDYFRVDRVITSSTTLEPSERRVHVDASAGDITITLHTASGFDRSSKFLKRVDATENTVSIVPTGSETIEFTSEDQLPNQGSTRLYYAYSGNWFLQ